MNTNVNRLSNAPQFVQLPVLTDVIAGTMTIDVEMPKTCLIDYVEVVVTDAFSASTTISAGYVGDTPDPVAFLASSPLTSTGVTTSAVAKRMGRCASDNMLRISVSAPAIAANDGKAYIKIWHVFEPNSSYLQDPDVDSGDAYILKPAYLYL
jgi:hypothetical protein